MYTAAQAEQGKAPFTGLCRRCHSDNLEGSERGPALKGETFMANWDQQDLDRLRCKIRDTMPPDDPGKLSEDDYVGLVSYILQANGYPAGSTNLDGGALSSISARSQAGRRARAAELFFGAGRRLSVARFGSFLGADARQRTGSGARPPVQCGGTEARGCQAAGRADI